MHSDVPACVVCPRVQPLVPRVAAFTRGNRGWHPEGCRSGLGAGSGASVRVRAKGGISATGGVRDRRQGRCVDGHRVGEHVRTTPQPGPPKGSGWGPTDSCWGPTANGWGPTDSGWGPTESGWGPTDSGWGPTDSSWGPIDSGWGPTDSRACHLMHSLNGACCPAASACTSARGRGMRADLFCRMKSLSATSWQALQR